MHVRGALLLVPPAAAPPVAAVPEPPPEPPAAPAAPAPPPRIWQWWLTRTSRVAQCRGCGRNIVAWAPRLGLGRVRSTGWWPKYHLDRACLAQPMAQCPLRVDEMVWDVGFKAGEDRDVVNNEIAAVMAPLEG